TTNLTISDGSGAFEMTPAGVAGSLTATPALNGLPVSFTSTVTVEFNNTNAAINDSFTLTDDTGAAQTQTLNLQAGPFVRVAAYSTTVTIGSTSLGGDFFFQSSKDKNGATTIEIGVANLTYNGGSSIGGLKNARGALVINPLDSTNVATT